jgi:hypothetical protein
VLSKKTVSTRAREGKGVCLPCSPQGKGGEEVNVKKPTDNCAGLVKELVKKQH